MSSPASNARVDRNKLESVYMEAAEVRERLERTLHRRITGAEWRQLQLRDLVGEYLRNPFRLTEQENWREFRKSAKRELDLLRAFREDEVQEQMGAIEHVRPEQTIDYETYTPTDPEDPVFARSRALGALDDLRSGGAALPRARMHGTLLPRGGVDGTLPQWVHVLAVELWMPAEEVMERHRSLQRTLMAEARPPRTHARAFDVARFVWELEKHYGRRLSWPAMCREWNEFPLTKPFDSWRDFRTNFIRGAEATPPRYIATDEELTKQVREASTRGRAVVFDEWARQVLAATVHQPE